MVARVKMKNEPKKSESSRVLRTRASTTPTPTVVQVSYVFVSQRFAVGVGAVSHTQMCRLDSHSGGLKLRGVLGPIRLDESALFVDSLCDRQIQVLVEAFDG